MKTLVLAALVLGMSSCASVNVEQNHSVPFDQYRKFTWVKPDIQANNNPLYHSQLADANIRQALSAELNKKGITEDDSQPDLLLTYHEYFQQESRQVANPAPAYPVPYSVWFRGRWIPVGYSYYYHPWNTGYHTEHYTEGTLIVDVIDARTNQLIWRGSIANPVNDPARLGKQFAREARQILTKYPAHV
ncbi:MAG: DUF4136 domain-containing protein [Siphonobacter aquaeclarae]|nr:DUF4136 domain-containing protein [Siphonobacter aquaeclarae]